ncbi:hypothetical protein V5279_36020 [Bradyrhizobium sp. 26S5]|uniref:hypothetical protein n=1 Tax=Bradyrhizobium sp. 26S5 TaxID=3139729 RepID=UPI0030CE4E4D
MSTESNSALAKELSGPLLTRDDIAALLVAYYGAVALDQVRADELWRACFPRTYKRGEWKQYRERHLGHMELLLDTLSLLSQEILVKLTVLATTRRPAVVRKVLIRLLAEGVTGYLVGERMWSAPEFFNALVKEADQGARTPKDGEGTVERMMRWLDPVDPLRISRECGYQKSVSPQIWR